MYTVFNMKITDPIFLQIILKESEKYFSFVMKIVRKYERKVSYNQFGKIVHLRTIIWLILN